MKRLQAMLKKNSSGGTSPAFPSGWDDTKNIYIANKHYRRYDHLAQPYWDPFPEYCENIPSQDTKAKLDAASINLVTSPDILNVGITRIDNTPLAEVTNDAWDYNSDFSDNSQRWTDGNDFNVFNFYYIYAIDSDMTNAQKDEVKKLRLYLLRKAIEDANPYVYGTAKQNITNRNLNTYYGTIIKGDGPDLYDIYKIGDEETLFNVQKVTFDFWSDNYFYQCYNYYGAFKGNWAPFSNGLTNGHAIYNEPNVTAANNRQIPKAAILAEINGEEIASYTTGSTTRTYYFTSFFVATNKVLTERSLL